MAIRNNAELATAVASASAHLQDIHDYAGRESRGDAKVQFPRGVMRTAGEYRAILPGYIEYKRASSCAYALMYLDVLWWMANRTDITLTAREMVLKSTIITLGTITEAVLTIPSKPGFGAGQDFKNRVNSAFQQGWISKEDQQTLNGLWDNRNHVHLKKLDTSEFGKYEDKHVDLPRAILDRLLTTLKAWHDAGGK